MVEFEVAVPFKEGLHARPATELVKVCMSIESDIVISKGNSRVNPKSILGIMSLGATFGTALNISVSGNDEAVGSEKLKSFFIV